ncbi:hypothetical protein R2R35_01175 [Anaerocolumna sp. AGMB13020]|uniref:hypothetical protein n=1 Tax=Anaerocolumna sp. AGMB13020 TaxID=3081750 RepID=UPI002955162A|nr:hypothetical protein [Anaerocolumna sp. AGMB13020]WOO37136.1 hypothetical protein R2R35_01175 [Anaerocolumna sp. AGMB13020]
MLIKILYIIFVTVYSLLLILAAIKGPGNKSIDLKKEKLPMITGGILTLLSSLAMLKLFLPYVILLSIGLILIHISSILNGYKLHGKLNLSHHTVKLVISALIIFLFCYIILS